MGSIFQEACIGLDYVELPDLSLPALQKRFTIPSELEELYKRYEQRFQVGKSVSPLPPQLRISLVFHVDLVAARMPWLGWEWASCWGRFQLVPISMLYYYIFSFFGAGTFSAYLTFQALVCVIVIAWLALDCKVKVKWMIYEVAKMWWWDSVHAHYCAIKNESTCLS